jgi:arginine exporter protein ArgO
MIDGVPYTRPNIYIQLLYVYNNHAWRSKWYKRIEEEEEDEAEKKKEKKSMTTIVCLIINWHWKMDSVVRMASSIILFTSSLCHIIDD